MQRMLSGMIKKSEKKKQKEKEQIAHSGGRIVRLEIN